jgi:uncharacterized membrane protein
MGSLIVIAAVLGWLVVVLFFVALCSAAKTGHRAREEKEQAGEPQATLRTRPAP